MATRHLSEQVVYPFSTVLRLEDLPAIQGIRDAYFVIQGKPSFYLVPSSEEPSSEDLPVVSSEEPSVPEISSPAEPVPPEPEISSPAEPVPPTPPEPEISSPAEPPTPPVPVPEISSEAGPDLPWNYYSMYFSHVPPDDTDHIEVSHHASIDFDYNTPFSISVWFRQDDLASAWDRTIISKYGGTGLGGRLYLQIDDTDETVHFRMSRFIPDFEDLWVRSSVSVSDTDWHHFVVTYDGSSNANGVFMYLDSIQIGKVILANTLAASISTTGSLLIGALDAGAGALNHWRGWMDELSLWNKELSPGEVRGVYTPYHCPADLADHSAYVDLISWWRFGDDPLDDDIADTGNLQDQKGGNNGVPRLTEGDEFVNEVPVCGPGEWFSSEEEPIISSEEPVPPTPPEPEISSPGGEPVPEEATLEAHWDVSNAATVTLNGADISQVDDQSGQARHWVQATANDQPFLAAAAQNGLDVATFNGANGEHFDTLWVPAKNAYWTVLMVIQVSGTADKTFLSQDAAGYNNLDTNLSFGKVAVYGALSSKKLTLDVHGPVDQSNGVVSAATIDNVAYQLIGMRVEGLSYTVLSANVNEAVNASSESGCFGSDGSATLYVGIRQETLSPLYGSIGECKMWSGQMSDAVWAAEKAALIAKWGV